MIAAGQSSRSRRTETEIWDNFAKRLDADPLKPRWKLPFLLLPGRVSSATRARARQEREESRRRRAAQTNRLPTPTQPFHPMSRSLLRRPSLQPTTRCTFHRVLGTLVLVFLLRITLLIAYPIHGTLSTFLGSFCINYTNYHLADFTSRSLPRWV